MNFERADLLGAILDDLSINDETFFYGLQQKILGEASSRGLTMSSGTVTRIFYAFSEKLYERGKDIFTEMERVLTGAHIENFDELNEALKSEWDRRIKKVESIALHEFRVSTASIRKQVSNPLSESDLLERIEKIRRKWFAEIDLFCTKLHDIQTPHLFLQAGEVFAGNRAARAVFTAATQSLDIIDTYFGSQVFDMLEITRTSVQIRLISDKASDRSYFELLAKALIIAVTSQTDVRLPDAGNLYVQHERVQRAVSYLESNFQSKLTIQDLARISNLSPFHFSRLFTRFVGLSPHEYILSCRLQYSARLLRAHPEYSIGDVALTSGFSDQSHFTRSFCHAFSKTPRAYRMDSLGLAQVKANIGHGNTGYGTSLRLTR